MKSRDNSVECAKVPVPTTHAPQLNPESITVCDPACGSGHILVYAFDLLAAMYEDMGYARRQIPQLILRQNLTGFEIDPRAAALASFALTMKAMEWDGRFLRRDVQPRIQVFESVEFDEGDLAVAPQLAGRERLLDAMAHLGECGSLFVPEDDDLAALAAALAALPEGDLFTAATCAKLQAMRTACEALSQRFDVVVANPPYMGSKNMNKWLGAWVKKEYLDVKSDLFSCFIYRIADFCREGGHVGMMTPYVWMFIGSYEKLRNRLIDDKTITSLVQLEYSGFAGATVPICTFTFCNEHRAGYRGGYVRLSDFVGAANQAPKTLEAIQNPTCGWFYRADATTFNQIPGTPIAYWVGEGIRDAYLQGATFAEIGHPKVGMQTSNNDKYLRLWWEVRYREFVDVKDKPIWINYLKGGDYRKWYGNLDWLLHYNGDPSYILEQPHAKVLDLSFLNLNKCTWTDLTSGEPSFRFAPRDTFYDISGHCFFPSDNDQMFLLGYANCSMVSMLKKMFNSSFHFQVGDLAKVIVPTSIDSDLRRTVEQITDDSVRLSKKDYDSFETSWDFKRHPLV